MGIKATGKRFARKFKSLSLYRERELPGSYNPNPTLLCELPLEILEMVASSLQLADLGALRVICKSIHGKTSSIFWKRSLQSIKTDLSHASLGELEKISRDAQLRHYVNQMVLTGFDQWFEILGGGYQWGSYRHQSGHLVNLQEHPAVKRLLSILCQLVNCKSFEIFACRTEVEFNNDNFRPTDSITTLLDIIAKAKLPVTAFTVNFMGNEFGYAPDPQRLQTSDKGQFVAIGQHLEDLTLRYTLEHDIVRDWTINMILHAPKLRVLDIRNQAMKGGTELIHCLASANISWSQLREFKIESIPASLEDLMIILKTCQHSLRVLRINMMRVDADLKDVKRMLQTLSTSFPALESVSFGGLMLGVQTRTDFIHFLMVSDNPCVDESQGTKFEFASNTARGSRNHYVAYSGPKMDVALDILARTVDCAPARIRTLA